MVGGAERCVFLRTVSASTAGGAACSSTCTWRRSAARRALLAFVFLRTFFMPQHHHDASLVAALPFGERNAWMTALRNGGICCLPQA